MNETMTMILQYFEDPADQFKLRMPGEFEKAKSNISGLNALKDKVKSNYGDLLSWFKVNAMKSADFCVLWDNFLIPPDLIINKDVAMKQNYLVPTFCQGKPPTVEDLMVLWDFKQPDEIKKTEKKRRKRDPEARQRRQDRRERDNPDTTAPKAGGGDGKAPDAAAEPLPDVDNKPAGKAPPGKGKPGKGFGKGKAVLAVDPLDEEEPASPKPMMATAPGKGKGKPLGKGKGKSELVAAAEAAAKAVRDAAMPG